MSHASNASPKEVEDAFLRATAELREATLGVQGPAFLLATEQWQKKYQNHPAFGFSARDHARSLREAYSKNPGQNVGEIEKKKLVLLIHGIRDQAEWMTMVKERLQSKDVVVQPIDYDYYDLMRFMTGFGVNEVIKRVTDKIRTAKENNVGAELIIIAHSFGTYVTSCILQRNSDIRCSRAVFCGSVVPKTFPFANVPHCPKIVNDCGSRDILPVLAQGFSFCRRYGASGLWGFGESGIEDRYHDFGHSGFLDASFVDKFWKPYVHDNEFVLSPPGRLPAKWSVSLLAFGWWFFIPLLCVLLGLGCLPAVLKIESPLLCFFAYAGLACLFLLVVVFFASGVWAHCWPQTPAKAE